jgi:hypothetical protein
MSIREEQCNKVCRILDDVLANRTTERDSLIVAVRKAFESLEQFGNSEQLPPAQPQRTCVNCGRTVNNGGWYADGGTRCPIEEHYALPKDGFCHLWEKRNVTDDDYPERREE